MAMYEASENIDRGGWCVYLQGSGIIEEYHSGPYPCKDAAIHQATKLSELGGMNTKPGGITYYDGDIPDTGIKKREGLKYITELPEGEPCVGMLMFKGTMYVATGKGVYKMVGDKLEAVQFVVKDGENCCEHGKSATEYCEPCGRVNGGG